MTMMLSLVDEIVTPEQAQRTAALLSRVRRRYLPPTSLKVSQFADSQLIVAVGPMAGTRWSTSFAPFQRGIQDVFHELGVECGVVMGSSQWGKTSCACNVVAYHIAHDPCQILVIEPTIEPMARDFARNRLEPMIEATPILRDAVSRKRRKGQTNTTLQKTFAGGAVSIGGANSAASLAARSTRLLVLDEIDRYPLEQKGEGNTLAIALKRTNAYKRRRRILMLSSPTVKGAPIHSWYMRGDQRRYFVPCPCCGVFQTYDWRNVQWDRGDPTTARLVCPHCSAAFTEAQRVAMLKFGEWRATRGMTDTVQPSACDDVTPETEAEDIERPAEALAAEISDASIASFHLSELYSPLSTLSEVVRGFMRAKAAADGGDHSEMHTWQNTTMGEPVEPDKGDGIEPNVLLLRREPVVANVDVPLGACCLTAGVDVQDDRLEILVFGWGPGEESWVVHRETFPGNTEQPEPWDELTTVLHQTWRHAGGLSLPIQAACIDSGGHRTTLVYDYALKHAARRVYAIIGRDGQRPIVSSPSPRRWGRDERQVPLYTIGVDAAKTLLTSRLKLTERGPGYVHMPHAVWCDEEFAAQLTSERLVTKFAKGVPRSFWKKVRTRNEALDCAVYATAALRLLNPRLPVLAQQLEELSKATTNTDRSRPAPSRGPAPRTPRKSKYIGG